MQMGGKTNMRTGGRPAPNFVCSVGFVATSSSSSVWRLSEYQGTVSQRACARPWCDRSARKRAGLPGTYLGLFGEAPSITPLLSSGNLLQSQCNLLGYFLCENLRRNWERGNKIILAPERSREARPLSIGVTRISRVFAPFAGHPTPGFKVGPLPACFGAAGDLCSANGSTAENSPRPTCLAAEARLR